MARNSIYLYINPLRKRKSDAAYSIKDDVVFLAEDILNFNCSYYEDEEEEKQIEKIIKESDALVTYRSISGKTGTVVIRNPFFYHKLGLMTKREVLSLGQPLAEDTYFLIDAVNKRGLLVSFSLPVPDSACSVTPRPEKPQIFLYWIEVEPLKKIGLAECIQILKKPEEERERYFTRKAIIDASNKFLGVNAEILVRNHDMGIGYDYEAIASKVINKYYMSFFTKEELKRFKPDGALFYKANVLPLSYVKLPIFVYKSTAFASINVARMFLPEDLTKNPVNKFAGFKKGLPRTEIPCKYFRIGGERYAYPDFSEYVGKPLPWKKDAYMLAENVVLEKGYNEENLLLIAFPEVKDIIRLAKKIEEINPKVARKFVERVINSEGNYHLQRVTKLDVIGNLNKCLSSAKKQMQKKLMLTFKYIMESGLDNETIKSLVSQHPDIRVSLKDSIETGNCEFGTLEFVKKHFPELNPETDTVAIKELLPFLEQFAVKKVILKKLLELDLLSAVKDNKRDIAHLKSEVEKVKKLEEEIANVINNGAGWEIYYFFRDNLKVMLPEEIETAHNTILKKDENKVQDYSELLYNFTRGFVFSSQVMREEQVNKILEKTYFRLLKLSNRNEDHIKGIEELLGISVAPPELLEESIDENLNINSEIEFEI